MLSTSYIFMQPSSLPKNEYGVPVCECLCPDRVTQIQNGKFPKICILPCDILLADGWRIELKIISGGKGRYPTKWSFSIEEDARAQPLNVHYCTII